MWDYKGDEMIFASAEGEMERFLSDRSSQHRSVRDRVKPSTAQILANSRLPLRAGLRVAFVENTSSLLTYASAPDHGATGTVIRIRTSSGDGTTHGGMAHVLWDGGTYQSIYLNHLTYAPKSARASTMRVASRVANVQDLPRFFRVASNGDLVHKSSRDLWSLTETSGQYVIERLFDVSGGPLKEASR